MTIELIILLLNLGSTFYMVGLIWFVQVVHYPLMRDVGPESYSRYQEQHQRRTTLVVGPAMLIEAFTSVLMVFFPPIPNAALLLLGVGLLLLIWVSTALLQVPCHGQLVSGFNEKAHRQLVLTNWIRTIAWTLRGMLVGWILLGAVKHGELFLT